MPPTKTSIPDCDAHVTVAIFMQRHLRKPRTRWTFRDSTSASNVRTKQGSTQHNHCPLRSQCHLRPLFPDFAPGSGFPGWFNWQWKKACKLGAAWVSLVLSASPPLLCTVDWKILESEETVEDKTTGAKVACDGSFCGGKKFHHYTTKHTTYFAGRCVGAPTRGQCCKLCCTALVPRFNNGYADTTPMQ